ncbi:uncharacterized protein involved in exopolysaccharide biosynthesis [Paucibacter oligotrophus]|uniref:Uncharacterized protein involved in exopolysaccharide biosynthesis n=1 Tax=Roseateles oligotrophus TaxID=1769250 RepID=A0A840L6T7_9BURK|nr:uncharacterized protein involved in exopolysaccharide biosynthesis [Roseateles oligotrophus]
MTANIEDQFTRVLHTTLQNWKLLTITPLLTGALALGISFLLPPIFTAKTTFLQPQQPQSSVSAALASLGPIAGMSGSTNSGRTSAEQYIAFLQSASVTDRIIDQFELQKLYDTPFKTKARKALNANVRITANKKDGIISIEVDDTDPKRAASLANRFVDELRIFTSTLALTEAQQRRAFFDRQLQATRNNLTKAQIALQGSGFDGNALKIDPKASAEAFAKTKAAVVAAEVKLQGMQTSLAPGAIELRLAESNLTALRAQLKLMADTSPAPSVSNEYIERYRDFKYQETLFELYARQLELARMDEARDGPLIQVIDAATPPELKSRPQRLDIAIKASLTALIILLAWLIFRLRFHR